MCGVGEVPGCTDGERILGKGISPCRCSRLAQAGPWLFLERLQDLRNSEGSHVRLAPARAGTMRWPQMRWVTRRLGFSSGMPG